MNLFIYKNMFCLIISFHGLFKILVRTILKMLLYVLHAPVSEVNVLKKNKAQKKKKFC